MSLDGFIATKEDGLEWLSVVEKEGEDYGYTAFTSSVNAYIIGRKTYDVVLNLTGGVLPQAEQYECYVITRQERADEKGVRFYNGDIASLIHKLKQEDKHIYCDGGGQIVQLLMQQNLIDEYIVSVIPILLGDGKRLFLGEIDSNIKLKLKTSKQFDTGLVQLHYIKI